MAKKLLDAPKRMGQKVKAIRLGLGFTQQQMYDLLKSKGAKIHLGYIGLYESDDRLPSHMGTLAYARAVGISTDILIDDELDLSKKLPGKSKNQTPTF
jgi:transcriptional regulator with XRE-family HTH domain